MTALHSPGASEATCRPHCRSGLCQSDSHQPLAGIPFRETHHISGAAVKLAEDRGCQLSDLTVKDLKGINQLFESDVVEVWDFNRWVFPDLSVFLEDCCIHLCVAACRSAEMRDTEGGASSRSVLEQVDKLKKYLADEKL